MKESESDTSPYSIWSPRRRAGTGPGASGAAVTEDPEPEGLGPQTHASWVQGDLRPSDPARLLEEVLEHAPSIVFIKDLQGRFLFINRRFEEQFAIRRAEVLGHRVHDFFPDEAADAFESNDRAASVMFDPIEVEEVAPTPDGERTFSSVKFALRDGSGAALVICGISTDITARKVAEAEAAEAKIEAERAKAAKDEFISQMNHELRTPLNGILGFAQVLQWGSLDEEQAASVGRIDKAGKHLLKLVDELSDMSQIDSGEIGISIESVDIDEVLEEATGLIEPMAREHGISIEPLWPTRASVVADRQRVLQVILNLLSNAIKYNHRGGTVQISLVRHEDSSVIAVTDTGPGIPLDRSAGLFEPFDRLGAEATGVQGTGLGLALSKRLAEAMGGSLVLRSQVGVGSTFALELKNAPASAGRGADETPQIPASANVAAKLLYIEDNLASLSLIQNVFRLRPEFTLHSAMQGRLGIELARSVRPDVVLLDLHLPDIGGEEVLACLRSDPLTSSIPVVMISADAHPDVPRRLLSAGATAFLAKPLDLRELLVAVDHALGD